MNKLENLIEMAKLNDLLAKTPLAKKDDEEKKCNVVIWVLAVVGIIAAAAAIAYEIYRHFNPSYLDDFDDDFEDEFEDEEEDADEDDFFVDEGEN